MSTTNTQSLNFNSYKQGEDTKKGRVKKLIKFFYNNFLSRILGVTPFVFIEQNYMITSWIKQEETFGCRVLYSQEDIDNSIVETLI